MGFESMPKGEPEKKEENNKDKPKKWLEFMDKRGVKTNVAVFEGEADEDALNRARSIDARLGDESTF